VAAIRKEQEGKLSADKIGLCCIRQMIEYNAQRDADAAAIAAPRRTSLSYGGLLVLLEEIVQRLNGLGLGRSDRIAVVLPNGPEMATAFLSVASAATCAPLNPAYREPEFDYYLSDLRAKALIVQEGIETPAVAAARGRGIPVLTLSPARDAEAGVFRLSGGGSGRAGATGFAGRGDVALVLHTSGTTARPKIVPLTHANLCASAHSIRKTLRLQPEDRCLNVMPLFHIHGLVGALLSSLSAGACVACTPGFEGARFFEWLEAFRPSWYTAVPTIHQSILAAAEGRGENLARSPLRFIRSSSAALPKRVMEELEGAFGVPVIESYGMTEAAHQMASNPLPPEARKPGSVGLAAGPEVAVMDGEGNLLPAGASGEVVIRGESVTSGYENAPDANAAAFVDGWFRTGDQGNMDADGYLYLTGRIKEIVNRGGFKISPQEVDDVLLEHPSVRQAVAFPVPHPTLGEDIAAAVVLRRAGAASEGELRAFALSRLTEYKVPTRVVFVSEIPKGPSGKLVRAGMGERLKDVLETGFVAPRDELEASLKEIWQWVLDRKPVGIRDNFFGLGGHSLLAVRMFDYIDRMFGKKLPPRTLFFAPTIEDLAKVMREDAWSFRWSYLVPVQPHGSRPPFFCVHPHDGDAFRFHELAVLLGSDQPFYGLQARTSHGERIPHGRVEEMAADYVEEIRQVQPRGPYYLGGHCSGGIVALEMARHLRRKGEAVALVALIFAHAPGHPKLKADTGPLLRICYDAVTKVDRFVTMFPLVPRSERVAYLREVVRYNGTRIRRTVRLAFLRVRSSYGTSYLVQQQGHVNDLADMISSHVPEAYPGRLTLFRTEKEPLRYRRTDDWGWGEIATAGVDVYEVPGYPQNQDFRPRVVILAQRLKACLDRLHGGA